MWFEFRMSIGRDRSSGGQKTDEQWCDQRHCTKRHCEKRHSTDDLHIVHHCGHRHAHGQVEESKPASDGGDNDSRRDTERTTNTPTNTNPQTACRLFDLPAEIRLSIYEKVFSVPEGTATLGRLPTKNHLALLQTCRRVLLEAEDIYYAMHCFIHQSRMTHHTVYNIARLLGPHRRNAVQRLTIIASNGAAAFGVISELHHFPNLKSCHFERETSVRYINISHWSLLAKQMRDQLAKLESLEEVKIFTPEPTGELPAWEVERKEKLNRIDDMLENGWRK